MALKHTALWISLAATSIAVQGQPIDQQTSVLQTADATIRTELADAQFSYAADVNNDQISDLIWVTENGIYQATGTGTGAFNATTTLYNDTASMPGYIDYSIVISGSNLVLYNDGQQDFIAKRANNAVSSVVSRITFFISDTTSDSVDLYSFPEVPLTENDYVLHDFIDINNDGNAELITIGDTYSGSSNDAVLKTFNTIRDANGLPTAITAQHEHTFNFAAGTATFQLELADLNGDQKLDAVFFLQNDSDDSAITPYNKTYGDLVVYYQQDNLTWSAPSIIKEDIIFSDTNTYSSELSNTLIDLDIRIADLDGDGNKDILTYQDSVMDDANMSIISHVDLFVLWQENDGSFTEQSLNNDYYFATNGRQAITLNDLNDDGQVDIIVQGINLDLSDPMAPGFYYNTNWFSNLGERQISSMQHLSPAKEAYFSMPVLINDFNQDQQKDMLLLGAHILDFNTGEQNVGLFYLNPDIFAPQVTFTPASQSHNNQAYSVDLTLNELVTGFDQSDVIISGGVISNWQENNPGLSYQFTVTPETDSDTQLSVKTQSFFDVTLQGNLQTSETTISAPIQLPADADGDGILDELESGDYNGDGIDDSLQVDPGIESGIGGGALNPLFFLLALPLLFAAHGARAQQAEYTASNWEQLIDTIENTAYVGVNFGFSYLNPEDGNSGWRQQDQHYGSQGLSFGFRPNQYSFVEYQHQQLGKTEFENNNPNIPGSQTLRYSANTLFGGVYLNEEADYKVFVRAGLSELHTKNSSSLNNDQQNKTLLATGTGVEWTGNEKWQLRLGADRYSADVYNLYFSAQYQIK